MRIKDKVCRFCGGKPLSSFVDELIEKYVNESPKQNIDNNTELNFARESLRLKKMRRNNDSF